MSAYDSLKKLRNGFSVSLRPEFDARPAAYVAEKDTKIDQLRQELDAWTSRVARLEDVIRKQEAAMFAILDHGSSTPLAADRVVTAERGSTDPIESIAATLKRRAETIKALADILERLWNFSAPSAETESLWPDVEAALRLAGHLP